MAASPPVSSPLLVHVAQTIACTEAEGPGRRFALWFQGCPLRCPGCCNPEMLPFAGGTTMSVEQAWAEVLDAVARHGVEGITLLGGEPMAHAPGAAWLAQAAQRASLSVMVFSGYTLDEIRNLSDPAASVLLAHTDILVDGPYRRDEPETRRRWIGSANQRVHFLTDRYRADDPQWRLPNTLEIRLEGNEVRVNGFPAAAAVDFWRRPPRSPAHRAPSENL